MPLHFLAACSIIASITHWAFDHTHCINAAVSFTTIVRRSKLATHAQTVSKASILSLITTPTVSIIKPITAIDRPGPAYTLRPKLVLAVRR